MNNGEVIAYSRLRHPNLKLVLDILEAAIKKHNPPEGLIVHSDQG